MGAASGKSLVALGLVELLSRRVRAVGFFRPIVQHLPDNDIELIRGRYDLADERIGHAFTSAELRRLPTTGHRPDAAMEQAVARYKEIEAVSDIVVIEGTDFTGASSPVELDLNARLARHLGAPVLAVVDGHRRTVDEVVESVLLGRESLGVDTILAIVVNRADPASFGELSDALAGIAGTDPVWAIPEEPAMRQPSLGQLADRLGARQITGRTDDLGRGVRQLKVAAMSVPNLLDHIDDDGTVLIAPGDRADVVVTAALTRHARRRPSVVGVVVSGGLVPDPRVIDLIDDVGDGKPLPLLSVESDSLETAIAAAAVEGAITPSDTRKIETGLGLFEAHVDLAVLEERIQLARSTVVTPIMFQYDLIERARAAHAHIVLPEGTDDRILQAADRLVRRRVCDLTLLGPEEAIRKRIAELDLQIGDVPIVDPLTSPWFDGFARRYAELRAHKGTTLERARDVLTDVCYFGTMMVHEGLADGMVSGAVHTTAHTIRPALEFIKTRPDASIVSSVFLMLLEDRVLVYGDCAINPDPDAAQLADIAISSAATAELFGIEPRIAMLSYSTGESGTGADVDKVRAATAMVRGARPDLAVEGPIQYDAAVDVDVAASKLPGSRVAGRATVFVFPDLNTGNNTYKAVQRSADAVAVGPVLQGLNKPVNDLSRGATVTDIVNTVAITAVQAGVS
jgi:phosphate acetyltransferase